jgi:hypothetical protein
MIMRQDDDNMGGNRQGSGRPGAPAEESQRRTDELTNDGNRPNQLSTDADRARQNNDDPSRAPESGDRK